MSARPGPALRRPLPPPLQERLTRVRHFGPMVDGDPRHGTDAGYVAGCREACCRKAHARRRKQERCLPKPLVPAVGTHRRIRALARLGWSPSDLSRRLGRHRSFLQKVLSVDQLQQETAALVAALYDELSMTLCTAPKANRTRMHAERAGWPPPLAWDDDRIDDPDYAPAGWEYVPATRREALLELLDNGGTLADACRHLRISEASLQKWCGSNGLSHVYRALAARISRHPNQHLEEAS